MEPSLYGINKSNRDFTESSSWGKNQFNSSFPASLACYMSSRNFMPVYLNMNNNLSIQKEYIRLSNLFGSNDFTNTIYFAFESLFTPYDQLIIGTLPRIDLVTQNSFTNECLNGLEIKLTALPDNSTCELDETEYGTELVIRPDTIVYLACSIVMNYKNNPEIIANIIGDKYDNIRDWSDERTIIPFIPSMVETINQIFLNGINNQIPLLLQPIWKTRGKSPVLDENCLDIFVWSNYAFAKLFLDSANGTINKITRQVRSIIWLFCMLYEFSKRGQFNHERIIDTLSYNTKNDKAFSMSGMKTKPYMQCNELLQPRIKKEEIRNIILGNGQQLLSPERRFDAIIFNSPELFGGVEI